MKKNILLQQLIPLALTIVVLCVLSGGLFFLIRILNALPLADKIILEIRGTDVLVGLTIYLKTAVDFALFMGRLMSINPGWKNRIAIEVGTGLGNAFGTAIVLVIWTLFKEVRILLAVMVFVASLVLFELAHGGLDHFSTWEKNGGILRFLYRSMAMFLGTILQVISPILGKVMPDLGSKLRGEEKLSWPKLFQFSFSIPFILGLDDFAGYVPLFSIINVFGFSIGVLAGHTILNGALFLSPKTTIHVVKNPWVSYLGSLAFILLAFWGLSEMVKILLNY